MTDSATVNQNEKRLSYFFFLSDNLTNKASGLSHQQNIDLSSAKLNKINVMGISAHFLKFMCFAISHVSLSCVFYFFGSKQTLRVQ